MRAPAGFMRPDLAQIATKKPPWPPGDSGAVSEGAVAAHLPREWRATCTVPAAPGAWDGRLDCSAPAILLRAKKSEVLLTAQISE